MKKQLIMALTTFTLLAPVAAHAQTSRPNFAGTFVMDPAQSDQGQGVPVSLTMQITQTANQFVVTRTQNGGAGDLTAVLTYALDGSTSRNEFKVGENPVNVATVITWDGASPTLSSSLKVGEADVMQIDKWSMIEDGKKLLINRTLGMGGQSINVKLMLVKKA
jgi:hypothetical protein